MESKPVAGKGETVGIEPFFSQHFEEINPNLQTLIFGYSFGMCSWDCMVVYKLDLGNEIPQLFTCQPNARGNVTDIPIEEEMGPLALEIALEFAAQIPDSVLDAQDGMHRIGCPDCDDGGALDFWYKLKSGKVGHYKMELDLDEASGEFKFLGDRVRVYSGRLKELRRV